MIDLAALMLSVMLRATDVQQPRIVETVTVPGTGPSIATPAAVTVLGGEDLDTSPASTVDDTLRAVPGFSLFRRSSSRVANPTTQGVTLRGLAASGASRALVLADGVPLNDPVGGWVYWNRVPVAALVEATVARGAAGDLHGADALAGAVTLRSTDRPGARMLLEGGASGTVRGSGYGAWTEGIAGLFAAGEGFTTDGFVVTAPESRGAIDVPSRSRHGSAHLAASLDAGEVRATLRGSHFGESRGNGTPVQRNSTRITQASGRLDGGRRWSARGYALTQRYEQTFSAVAAGRATERQTSAQAVTAVAIGGATDWSWSSGTSSILVSGAGRFVDAELEEVAFSFADVRQPPRLTKPHQATGALALQGRTYLARASFGGGLRAELWRSAFESTNRHVFFSPRLWAVYAASDRLSLRVSLQSGHRGPTINELYRPFRVGSVVTEANPDLRPEAARGLEFGASWRRNGLVFRAIGFWSRVDDAITNVTLSSGGDVIIRQRQNAARIRAAGAELEVEARLSPLFTLTGASSFTDSTFTRGPLEGLRVPQVPGLHHAVGVRASGGKWRASAGWRYIGRQFDDDRNDFALSSSSIVDARIGWLVRRGIEVFAAVENLTDADQDVGRTPLRTVGLPRTSRAGVRFVF